MALRHFLAIPVALLLSPLAIAWADEASPTAETLPLTVRNVLVHRDLPPDTLSLMVVDIESGEAILSHQPDVARNPASVMKLVTTLVALDMLGPAYRWKTEAWAQGEVSDGVLAGDLLLKGYGDPFLVTERVWQMARSLRNLGLETVSGDLLLDDSYFDVSNYDPAAFDRQPLRAYNVEPNALMMNFKVIRYFFEPDVTNNAVQIRMDPELSNLKIVNRLSVKSGYCGGYQRGIAINPNESYDQITFSGRFPSDCEIYSMTRAALDHNEFTFGLFRRMWQDVGGDFDGGWRNIEFTPPEDDEPLLSFDSWPLADVISRVNKYSNNVMARHLLLTVAAHRFDAPGTEANGRQAVRDWMFEKGFEGDAVTIANGAGLSRSARITARQLTELLRYAYAQPYMPEFLSSMSLPGLDGTLSRRFDERDSLAGRAHLKTGSLDHVAAIAGYVQAQSGNRYAVVTLQNHRDVHRGYGDEVQEALLRWVFEQ